MVKPNFLGIGCVRGGSTWLYDVLKSHPDIWMPNKRKEIQYFTRYYEKGQDWYCSIFEGANNTLRNPKWIGEFTPGYFANIEAPSRIFSLGSVNKFVIICRNPVDRAISHYYWHLRVTGQNISFTDFVNNSPKLAIENGLYYKNLLNYLKYFKLNQFLILIFEEVMSNPLKAIEELSDFLEIDKNGFVVNQKKANSSNLPHFRKSFVKLRKFSSYLRAKDLDFLPNFLNKVGAKKFFEVTGTKNKIIISNPEREKVFSKFRLDIEKFETILGRKINWGA